MKDKIYVVIIFALSIVFAVSVGFLIKHNLDSAKQAEIYDNLVEIVETQPDETQEPIKYSEDETFIPEYQELYMQNNDMVGWIKVDGTKINYPVMQSKDNPDFYLKHGFDKAYTDYGCPYVQENCDLELPSDNIVIYGHHMNDGAMFAGLMKYADKSFWEKHKTIAFDTLTQQQNYEVIAVFKRLCIRTVLKVSNIIVLSMHKRLMSLPLMLINARSCLSMIPVLPQNTEISS